jgi:hypothetical protein
MNFIFILSHVALEQGLKLDISGHTLKLVLHSRSYHIQGTKYSTAIRVIVGAVKIQVCESQEKIIRRTC